MIANLGAAFVKDSNNLNDGYPVLKWQTDSDPTENRLPTRKEGVPASHTEYTDDDASWRIDLSTIFMDEDGDALTYFVREGDGAYTAIEGDVFEYTLTGFDAKTFVFTANDGQGDGATYTVTLGLSLGAAIAGGEQIVADPSGYYTEGDYWDGAEFRSGRKVVSPKKPPIRPSRREPQRAFTRSLRRPLKCKTGQ